MAEEAFALSPISARAALPGEEDYAAISAAFMETSRGRWFLGEYAKRNRNADTRMVLDAVARIEESLAAQKQTASDTRLTEALASIRQAVGATQTAATAALDAMALDQHLAPIRKGVRVIREISWRLREIGADGRICDIIDSQANAIETGAGQISSTPARSAVDAAFADLLQRIRSIRSHGDSPAKAKTPEQARVVPFPVPAEPAPAPEVETAEAGAAQQTMEAHRAEPVGSSPEAQLRPAPVAEPVEIVDEAAAEAHDEAMLDLIAAEMSAPDPIGIADSFEMFAEAAPGRGGRADRARRSSLKFPSRSRQRSNRKFWIARTAHRRTLARTGCARTRAEISLGSSIIASGMLKKPGVPANDPLAPIRRMSQAEGSRSFRELDRISDRILIITPFMFIQRPSCAPVPS